MNGYMRPVDCNARRNSTNVLAQLFPKLRLNSVKPLFYNSQTHQNLCRGSAETVANDLCSAKLLRSIRLNDPVDYDFLIQGAKHIQRNFRKFRVGRLLKDTLPRHDLVTPKKAIKCMLTEAQCRTLLIRALHLVFGRAVASSQQIYKFVCLLIQILFLYMPNRNPTSVELNLFKQLLQIEMLLTRELPSQFRREFTKNFVLYLVNFCCNLLSHCFYATLSTSGNSIALYQRKLWNKIQAYSFKKLAIRQGLNEVQLNVTKPTSRLRLLPKANGVRPIGVAMSKFDLAEIANARIVLNHLCKRAFPESTLMPTLNNFRRNFANTIRSMGDAAIYYCTGDLLDCFNKIDYFVICKFLAGVGLDNVYHIATQNVSARKSRLIGYGISQTAEKARSNLQALLNNKGHVTRFNYMKITGEELRRLVRDYAFKPQIFFAGKYYQFRRGMLQGSPLSAILNEIFVLSFEKQLLKRKNLMFQRHVDDYIFFSTDKATITSTIIKLLDGSIRFQPSSSTSLPVSTPRFGCTKVRINFDSEALERFALKKSKVLFFCGNMIDTHRKLLLIDYDKYKCRTVSSSFGKRRILCKRLRAISKLFVTNAKYSIDVYLKRFIDCYSAINQHDRPKERRRFLRFMFEDVLLSKAANLNLDIRKRKVKQFLRQQLKIISKRLTFRIRKLVI